MKNKNNDLYTIEDDIKNLDNLLNGWWWYTNQREYAFPKGTRTIANDKEKSNPKICPKCNYVWARENISRTINSRFLVDFPRYGLKKAVCYFCVPYEKQRINKNAESTSE
tara:strand:- start:47 stop:376 length:330 start_codon:yes stop_codon:yes gene_type:complete